MDSYAPSPELADRATGGTEQSWCKAAPGGTGTTAAALRLSPPIDPAILQSALRELQRRHPILRAKLNLRSSPPVLSISSDPYIHLQTHDAAATATAEILDANPETSDSAVQTLLVHGMNQKQWEKSYLSTTPVEVFFADVYAIPNPDSAVVVVLRAHTAVADRVSGAAIARELLGLIRDMESGRNEGEPDGGFRGEVLPSVEDLIPQEHTKKRIWSRGKDMLGYSLNFTRSSMLPFADARSARRTDLVRLELGVEETQRLLSGCKERGIKLCGALTAAGLIATVSSKHLPSNKSESYCVITLVDCRKRLRRALTDRDIGFYHSAIQNIHTVKGGEGLWELSARCYNSSSSSLNSSKHFTDMADLNFLMMKSLQTPQLTPSSSMRTALISVFEEPLICDTAEFYQGVGVEDYIGCASVHGVGPSIALFDTIMDGKLSCACLYPSPLHSRKQMQDLVDDMKRILIGGIANSTED